MDGREGGSRLHHKVLITVPCQPHWLHKRVARNLFQFQNEWHTCPLVIDMPSNKPLENTQHHIIQDFLAGDYTHWLSFDADTPLERNPLELLALDKDIIGCPTPVWHWTGKKGERPIYLNAYQLDPSTGAYREWPTKSGLQRVDAIGGGCMLIARRVFEHTSMQGGAFLRKLNPDGTVERGNDIAFSERARAAGFEIWTHYDYMTDHCNELSLKEVWESMYWYAAAREA